MNNSIGKYKISVRNFKKICRLCLSENVSKSRDVFQKKMRQMLEYCSSIKLNKSTDTLPSQICLTCSQNLIKFYTFRRKIEKNDRVLRKHSIQIINKEDILNIAVNEADIEKETSKDAIVNILDTENNSNVDKNELKPLENESEEKHSLWPRKTKGNALKIINNINESETDNTEFPLLKDVELKNEPPPLVAIKPIVNETVLSNIIGNISLECSKCDEKFTSVAALKEHKIECSPLNSLACNICKKEFKERKKLIGHLKGHMVTKNYECKICNKRYPNPSTFEIHMRTHTGERPFKCQLCSKGFTRWAGVVSHMQTHYDHRPFKCEICNKTFKVLWNLERHKVLHSGIMPFCCNYCGKTFSQSDNLQLHIRSCHTNERPFLCSQCGKGFVSSTRLNRHMWVHKGYKPFRCDLCPKAYSNSSDLKNHERAAHGDGGGEKPFACSLCEMRFFHPCRLSRHLRTHQRPFACSNCNKTFSSNLLLDKHVENSHSPEDL